MCFCRGPQADLAALRLRGCTGHTPRRTKLILARTGRSQNACTIGLARALLVDWRYFSAVWPAFFVLGICPRSLRPTQYGADFGTELHFITDPGGPPSTRPPVPKENVGSHAVIQPVARGSKLGWSVITTHVTSAQRWPRSPAEAPRARSVIYPRQQEAPRPTSAGPATGAAF